jgi:rSAM/selenodomain-associated transferase 2/rSAM/selenodomain-associated transferase 1
MKSNKSARSDRLIIFGRYPVPGRTKTRLVETLGQTGAADLQRSLTEETLKKAKKISAYQDIEVEVCFEGGNELKMRRWLGSDIMLSQQVSGDLGERMYSAFLEAFKSGCRRVVLLGTDIPQLTPDHLKQAFDALHEHDIVLGPSTDGGYWLMGLNKPTDLFKEINWGTENVLDQTVARAKEQNIGFHQLKPLTDIDTVDDLEEWRPDGIDRRPYVSIIIPTLNEEQTIETTLYSARNEEAEIIVVDGGSTDDTVNRATDAGVRVVMSPRGRAVQQNRGAELAQGMVLLFLHADTLLPSGYVAHIFEALMDPRAIGGAFRFKTDLNSPLMKTLEFLINIRSGCFKLPYGDQGIFMRKSVFNLVGGFPELAIAEDLFLVRKLSRRGRIQIAPAQAITSARRWRRFGILRTTLINQVIVAGCYLGISPRVLASLYKSPGKPT